MRHFAGLNFALAAAGIDATVNRRARACEQLAEPMGWAAILTETLNFTHNLLGQNWSLDKSTRYGWNVVTYNPAVTPEPGMYAAWFCFAPRAEGGFAVSAHSHGEFHLLTERRLEVGVTDDGTYRFETADRHGTIVQSRTLAGGDDVLAQFGAWMSRNFQPETLARVAEQAPKIAGMKDFQMPVARTDHFSRYHPCNPDSPARKTPAPAAAGQLTAA